MASTISLLHLSDTHCFIGRVQADALPSAHVLIHTGDFLCNYNKADNWEWAAWLDVLRYIRDSGKYAHIVLIFGNHEVAHLPRGEVARVPSDHQKQLAGLKRKISKLQQESSSCGIHVLIMDSVTLRIPGIEPSLKIQGYSWMAARKWDNTTLLWGDGDECFNLLESPIEDPVHVVLTHGPPYRWGKYAALPHLEEMVERIEPALVLCGHEHGANNNGTEKWLGAHKSTLVVNSSMSNPGTHQLCQPAHLIRARPKGKKWQFSIERKVDVLATAEKQVMPPPAANLAEGTYLIKSYDGKSLYCATRDRKAILHVDPLLPDIAQKLIVKPVPGKPNKYNIEGPNGTKLQRPPDDNQHPIGKNRLFAFFVAEEQVGEEHEWEIEQLIGETHTYYIKSWDGRYLYCPQDKRCYKNEDGQLYAFVSLTIPCKDDRKNQWVIEGLATITDAGLRARAVGGRDRSRSPYPMGH